MIEKKKNQLLRKATVKSKRKSNRHFVTGGATQSKAIYNNYYR